MSSVLTRNMSSVIDQIDVKLSNLKNELISELKDQILFELKSFIHDQMNTIKDLNSKVIQNESTIAVLQNNMERLKHENKSLRNKVEEDLDEICQYSRRQCLRLNGIEVGDEREESEDIVNIVKKKFEEVGMNVPDICIDRAHRIGRTVKFEGKKYRPIIVKFNNFRTRTLFYQKRNTLKNNVKIRIDLTKRRYQLLQECRELIDGKKLTDVYIFPDINCRLKIVDKSSKEETFINSLDEAKIFISQS